MFSSAGHSFYSGKYMEVDLPRKCAYMVNTEEGVDRVSRWTKILHKTKKFIYYTS